MAENLDNGLPNEGRSPKSDHRMVAETILFSRRWYGGIISANMEVIWETWVESIGRPLGMTGTKSQERCLCDL